MTTLTSVRKKLGRFQGKLLPSERPRFLFRGESEIYPEIKSTFGRIDESCKKRIQQASRIFGAYAAPAIAKGMDGFLSVGRLEAVGLLQHYGWPTPLIDLTGTVEVAIFFALRHAKVGQTAVIYKIDCEAIPEDNVATIIEYDFFVQKDHPLQNRWLYQDGFGIAPKDWDNEESSREFDLLSEKLKQAVTPYEFTVTADDSADINDVLSIKNDLVAQKFIGLLKIVCEHEFGTLDALDPELRKIIEPLYQPDNSLGEASHGRRREYMTALAFDTHKAVKALREAGADEPLAEAVVATVGDAIGGNVATKADLAEVKAELKADIAEVKAELKSDIAALGTGLYRHLWMMAVGIVGLTVGLTVTLVKMTTSPMVGGP